MNVAGEQIHHSHSYLDFHLHDPTIYLVKSNFGDRLNTFLPVKQKPLSVVYINLSRALTGLQPMPLRQIADVKGQG